MNERHMTSNLKQFMQKFIAEAGTIDGAEDAGFEVSKEYEKCLILTGEIYGEDTNHKINELGRIYGLTILARDLSIVYEKPIRH